MPPPTFSRSEPEENFDRYQTAETAGIIRTYRRVETPPGAPEQTDWGEYTLVNV